MTGPAKIILSRKGFDSGSGGGPSPIIDNTMVSLPIPERGGIDYADIRCRAGGSIADTAAELGISNAAAGRSAHLDPDLDPGARTRPAGWRPSLGQAGAASAHLHNQDVGPGDLFVFWGLFRHTERRGDGTLTWAASRPFHAVFGWLRVGDVIDIGDDPTPSWATEHPHVTMPWRPNNRLYVAETRSGHADAGVIDWDPRRRLSAPDGNLSTWHLPAGCHPERSGATLTYHSDGRRWRTDGDRTVLRTVGRGQEFVVAATDAWTAWAEHVTSP